MSEQYFFQFSSGYYSDYSVGGLYVCAYPVDESVWDAHYEAFQNNLKATEECAMIAYGERVGCGHEVSTAYSRGGIATVCVHQPHKGWWSSIERDGCLKWSRANNPEDTFIALHNMTYVEVTECWRDI